jgi:hypothetical protein
VALATLVIGDPRMPAQHPDAMKRGPILHVHLYDRANVPRQILDRAIEETENILASAGVQSVFEPGDANSSEGDTLDMTAPIFALRQTPDIREFLVVRIVRGGLPAAILPRMLGYAFPWTKRRPCDYPVRPDRSGSSAGRAGCCQDPGQRTGSRGWTCAVALRATFSKRSHEGRLEPS